MQVCGRPRRVCLPELGRQRIQPRSKRLMEPKMVLAEEVKGQGRPLHFLQKKPMRTWRIGAYVSSLLRVNSGEFYYQKGEEVT